jgi:Glu-tRNA(Gln) amidotransferase subunit E-like FAD-binding protein
MTDAATNYFAGASELQKRPITEAQWADAVEAYQRAKLMKDAVDDLVKAFAQQSGATSAQVRYALKARADSKEAEARDDLQGRLELLGGGE